MKPEYAEVLGINLTREAERGEEENLPLRMKSSSSRAEGGG